jgi:tRNA-binding protein
MIAFYNSHVGDVLMLIVANNEGAKLEAIRQSDVTRVFRTDTGVTVAWNFFGGWSQLSDGAQELTDDQLADINKRLSSAGFSEVLLADRAPKFVVAEIISAEPHPDSDHLQICQVNVGAAEPQQIVCGAPNARAGLKTVAALPGTMMPDGRLIWSGELRGILSDGMLCSPGELALPNAPQERGIIELRKGEIGQKFNAETMWYD